MILYFTGTGNSKYVAEKIAEITGDELIDLNEKIKNWDITPFVYHEDTVIVAPTYAWRIPRIVEDYLRDSLVPDVGRFWFVMTCGGEIGNAAKYNKELCESLARDYMGTYQIVMPENYIAMFSAPDADHAKRIIEKAEPSISQAAEFIKKGDAFPKPRNNPYDKFMSAAVNPIFYRIFVKADAFVSGDGCTGCGLCEKKCPLNNIKIVDGKPVWGKDCTHCMACIAYCSTKAIEYGNKSKGKPRYHI